MNYHTVFDVANAGYKSWSFPAFGLIFVAIGAGLFIRRRNLPVRWSARPRASAAFAGVYLAFSVFWTATAFLSTYGDYRALSEAESSGEMQIAEGRVTDFRPMPAAGHAMERFCVADDCFEYSDFVITGGFNNTSSHGGPIRSGLAVRVSYVHGKIVKLEVAE